MRWTKRLAGPANRIEIEMSRRNLDRARQWTWHSVDPHPKFKKQVGTEVISDHDHAECRGAGMGREVQQEGLKEARVRVGLGCGGLGGGAGGDGRRGLGAGGQGAPGIGGRGGGRVVGGAGKGGGRGGGGGCWGGGGAGGGGGGGGRGGCGGGIYDTSGRFCTGRRQDSVVMNWNALPEWVGTRRGRQRQTFLQGNASNAGMRNQAERLRPNAKSPAPGHAGHLQDGIARFSARRFLIFASARFTEWPARRLLSSAGWKGKFAGEMRFASMLKPEGNPGRGCAEISPGGLL